jgi:IS5 family transposase
LNAKEIKAGGPAKMEPPSQYIKQVFGCGKVRYCGLTKNTRQVYLLPALSNLLIGEDYQLA